MGILLYSHNEQAYRAALSMLAETGKAAIVHPTGTGKSFIGFKLCEDNPDKTVLWLSPSEYIFKTQLENLKAAGGDEPQNIRFLTYAKLMNMSEEEIKEIDPALTVWDEYHRAGASQWQLGVQRFLKLFPDVPVLGLTATAIRYLDDQRDMSEELFDGNVASEMTLGEAIVRGILNPPKYVLSVFSYQKDLEKYERRVKTAKSKATRDAAERYLEALRRALDKADGLDVIFDKHMTDRTGKYIVFCANKEHMDEMIEKSREWFAKVDKKPHIYSVYTVEPGADKVFEDFKADSDSTHLRLLYCIDALNEGIHVENVSGVILLRPTISPIIYKQQIGRALSASKKNDAVIFDVVMNIENLYSIDSVEEEMRVAMTYYRSWGESSFIVNEKFKVIDELRDCRELFEKLNDTLTASWDTMYAYAKGYYEQHGNLEVPQHYKTADGYSLGTWLGTQRQIRNGTINGVLNNDRIAKLDAIGMRWESYRDTIWEKNYAAAKKYYEENGNLLVPAAMPGLGTWITNLRNYRKSAIRNAYLTKERIAKLDAIGMVWTVPDYLWERNFAAAMEYHREHGSLNVPGAYVAPNGVRLGTWLHNQRSARRKGCCTLTASQIAALDELGMVWGNKNELQWEIGYAAAKSYYEKHGDLNVSWLYKTGSGFDLGKWVSRQKEKQNAGKMSHERYDRLRAIGMQWERIDPWEYRFSLAEAYFKEHGNLQVPARCNVEGVDLSKWLSDQRQNYYGNRKQKLTEEQIRRLGSIGMEWKTKNEVAWDKRYAALKAYFDEHGNIDVPLDMLLSDGKDGKSLALWMKVQRKYYREGKLTDEQIEKLNAVGMVWDLPDTWEVGFAHAEQYYRENGNLLVPTGHVCADGYNLRSWINNQRANRNHPTRYHAVTDEQAERLEKIGMVWNVAEQQWNESYELAVAYFRENANLDVPAKYKTSDGFALWEWLSTQRKKRREGELSADRIQKLDALKMDWMFPTERDWENYYAEAQRFYLAHGNLSVPVTYRTETGMWLGRWVAKQKKDRNKLKTSGANGNQIRRLDELGMIWNDSTVTAIKAGNPAVRPSAAM